MIRVYDVANKYRNVIIDSAIVQVHRRVLRQGERFDRCLDKRPWLRSKQDSNAAVEGSYLAYDLQDRFLVLALVQRVDYQLSTAASLQTL